MTLTATLTPLALAAAEEEETSNFLIPNAAFFVELVFDSGDEQAPYKFTTQVQVVPDVLPHSFEEFRKTLK